MGLFKHKERYALSDILKGLHHAVNRVTKQYTKTIFWKSSPTDEITA